MAGLAKITQMLVLGVCIVFLVRVSHTDAKNSHLLDNWGECGSNDDCHRDECCASHTVLALSLPITRIQWRCKKLAKRGEMCSSFSTQYCKCRHDLQCVTLGMGLFGTGICVPHKR